MRYRTAGRSTTYRTGRLVSKNDFKAKAERRKKNKAVRKSRRINRGRR